MTSFASETSAPSGPAKATANFAPNLTIPKTSSNKDYLAFIRSCGARLFVASSQKRRSLLTPCAPRRWLSSQNQGVLGGAGNGSMLRPARWGGRCGWCAGADGNLRLLTFSGANNLIRPIQTPHSCGGGRIPVMICARIAVEPERSLFSSRAAPLRCSVSPHFLPKTSVVRRSLCSSLHDFAFLSVPSRALNAIFRRLLIIGLRTPPSPPKKDAPPQILAGQKNRH